jgi:2-methylisocitrate lyase-like PEP mutase family enzyme
MRRLRVTVETWSWRVVTCRRDHSFHLWRAECFLYGHPDPLVEAITRLQAYADAGADVLFAPGIRTRDDIATLVSAVRPVPVNVLMSTDTGLTTADLAQLGVRRISVGSALSRVAWDAFLGAAREMLGEGSFQSLAGATSFEELNRLFGSGENA